MEEDEVLKTKPASFFAGYPRNNQLVDKVPDLSLREAISLAHPDDAFYVTDIAEEALAALYPEIAALGVYGEKIVAAGVLLEEIEDKRFADIHSHALEQTLIEFTELCYESSLNLTESRYISNKLLKDLEKFQYGPLLFTSRATSVSFKVLGAAIALEEIPKSDLGLKVFDRVKSVLDEWETIVTMYRQETKELDD